MAQTSLRMDEANALLSAWAQTLAQSRQVRLVILKGEVLTLYGLRAPRAPSDVDVLVEPVDFERYVDAVISVGWREFAVSFSGENLTDYSRTLRRDGWPNSLAVHSYFLGFLRDPTTVFERIWGDRRAVRIANTLCVVLRRSASLFMLALHSTRGSANQPRHHDELNNLSSIVLTEAEKEEAGEVAISAGARLTMGDVLDKLGVVVRVDELEVDPVTLQRWRTNVEGASTTSVLWRDLLRRSSWVRRPAILAHAIWPRRRHFLIDNPEAPNRGWDLFRAQATRLGRAVVQVSSRRHSRRASDAHGGMASPITPTQKTTKEK